MMRAIAGLGTCLMLFASEARAETNDACLSAADSGQSLRDAGKLLEARKQLLVCAAATCPQVVRADCARWYAEVVASTPTLVVTATADGHDVTDVSVTIDGEALLTSIDGLSLPLDPGRHVVRAVRDKAMLEETVVLAEGEKNRKLALTFPSSRPARTATATEVAVPGSPKPGVLPYVLGGLGVVGLAGFGYFGLSGRSEYESLERSCAPGCTDAEVAPAREKMLVADVSLVVSVLSVGAALALWLTAPTRGH